MRRFRKRQTNLLKLGDFLHKTLKRRKINLDMADSSLVETWNKSVGKVIATQTFPFKIKNNTLFVKVSNSTWMQQLQYMKQDIIDKVNTAFVGKTVKDIYFSIGKIPALSATKDEIEYTSEQDLHSLKKRDRRLIRESLKSIDDEELRSIIKRVMTKELSKRRLTEEERYSLKAP